MHSKVTLQFFFADSMMLLSVRIRQLGIFYKNKLTMQLQPLGSILIRTKNLKSARRIQVY